MSDTRSVGARIALVLLTVVGLLSLYQALFWMWMTAYSPANAPRAKMHADVWLAIAFLAVIGFVVVLVRKKKANG